MESELELLRKKVAELESENYKLNHLLQIEWRKHEEAKSGRD